MRRANVATVAVPAAVAGALSVPDLTTRSLSLDEGATAAIVAQHGAALGRAIAHDGGNMSAYYALMHGLTGWLGHGLVALRAPSAIAAAITAALVARLGLTLFDRRTGLSAGLLAAVSLPLVFWGQTARGDAAMMMFVAGSYVALVAVLQDRSGRRAPPLIYGATVAAAAYTGLLAVLVVPAQLVLLRWHPDRRRAVIGALAGAGVACVPLAVLAAHRGAGQLAWVSSPSLRAGLQVLDELVSAGQPPNFHTTVATTVVLAATLVLLAAAALVLCIGGASPVARAHRTPGGGTIRWQATVAPLWLGVPLALVLAESFAGQPLLVARNLLVALPAVSLLVACAAWRLGPRVALPLLGALLVLRAAVLAPAYGTSPENWHAATAYVLARTSPSACVAFYPADARMPFRYYLKRQSGAPTAVLPSVPWNDARPFVEDYAIPSQAQLAALPVRCAQVWLVAGHVGRPTGSPSARGDYARYLVLRRELAQRYRASRRAAFGYAPAVQVELFTGAASSRRTSARSFP